MGRPTTALRDGYGRGMRELGVIEASFPGRPAFDTAVSRALLTRVGRGDCGETLRLYVPDDVLAFSVLDRVRPGFDEAVRAARSTGFAPMLRLAGGRAAAFSTQSLAFAWCVPDADARHGIEARFVRLSDLVCGALQDLGVDARVGAVAGEYCPGEHSVNVRGRRKVMGVGQRLVRGAAHVGGVIVVREAPRLAKVLAPVYAAMELELDPDAVGSLDQELPDITLGRVRDALLARFAADAELAPREPEPELVSLAEGFESEHRL